MLRISENKASHETTILLVEGQVSHHWVEVTREACEQALTHESRLILDLAGVTFADRAGVALLQSLRQQHVQLINCSPFLQEQLKDPATI